MRTSVGRIIAGVLAGVIVGLLVNQFWTAQTWASMGVGDAKAFLAWKAPDANTPNSPNAAALAVRVVIEINAFVGQAFIRLLRFAAVPLVLFSIIAGIASIAQHGSGQDSSSGSRAGGDAAHDSGGLSTLRRLGLWTLAIYTLTGVSSTIIGLLLTRIVRPGSYIDASAREALLGEQSAAAAAIAARTDQIKGLPEQVLSMIPTNPFDALARGDMMQVIVLAVVIGAGLLAVGRERAGPIAGACETLSDIMGRFVRGVMSAAPIAVFCLLAPAVAGLGLGVLKALSVYCLCVLAGLVLVMGGVYAPLIAGLARMNPIRFFHALGPAQLVAFSSSSSNATLPVTMQCVVERVGVPRSIAGFVCPLGATVNMDGTSVYLGVAVAFITQALGIELTLGQQLMLVVSITLAAVGSPGIPGGSLVFLVAMLQTLGVPAEGIALILGVDRLLDMARTVVNVVGDGVASAVVARFERNRGNSGLTSPAVLPG